MSTAVIVRLMKKRRIVEIKALRQQRGSVCCAQSTFRAVTHLGLADSEWAIPMQAMFGMCQ
jgi:hypothetical protein